METLPEALDGSRFKQVGTVLNGCFQTLPGVVEEKRQVKLGGLGVNGQGGDLQVQPGRRRIVAQHKHDLEQRRAAEVAARLEFLYQALEGQVLMGVGFQGGFAHGCQRLTERGAAGQVGAQHQGVEEEANQVFGLRVGAVGNGGTDDHIRLVGVAVEPDLKGSQHGHEEGGALSLA